MKLLGWALVPNDLCPHKWTQAAGRPQEDTGGRQASVYKPRREAAEQTSLLKPYLALPISTIWENKFLLSHPWYWKLNELIKLESGT